MRPCVQRELPQLSGQCESSDDLRTLEKRVLKTSVKRGAGDTCTCSYTHVVHHSGFVCIKNDVENAVEILAEVFASLS